MPEPDFVPRPGQADVLTYTGGKMGISAVPGSGKTETLSRLAEKLLAQGLHDDAEVLVVTMTNSAVQNFSGRLSKLVAKHGLLPNFGYRVRTLHSLAHDIVKRRPDLVQLADDFAIVDNSEANRILEDAAEAWVHGHPDFADAFIDPDIEGGKLDSVKRKDWPRLVTDIAGSFIKQAKDALLSPEDIRAKLTACPDTLPLAEMGCAIYADYQHGLRYRGAVDFDDLIMLALRALTLDEDMCGRLAAQWPYVLEDEAQDSSRLQEHILRALTERSGNWVRVGDPNQAIYETFTTANPKYLRSFLAQEDTAAVNLPHSGRSTQSIINLANHLIEWTQHNHPVKAVRDALTPPLIEPVPEGQPQGNPPDMPSRIYIYNQRLTPDKETEKVVRSLAGWLPKHPDATVAVLVPRIKRGTAVVDTLKQYGIDCVDMLRTAKATRNAAGALGEVLSYLANPTASKNLATVYKVWQRNAHDDDAKARIENITKMLRGCRHVESFLWPRDYQDWADAFKDTVDDLSLRAHLEDFRALVCRWQEAALLPIDQLVLTIAQDLFETAADLALAHSMALFLQRVGASNPDWHLSEMAMELKEIEKNMRKFQGFGEADADFDPGEYRGKVVVKTMHGAKGLEWDRVYLMSVNNYDYPSAQAHDSYIGERWFVRGNATLEHLNLQAEALAQLDALDTDTHYEEGAATLSARMDYVSERLRLLYVGITRARKELIITWNTGRRGDMEPSAPLIELQTYLADNAPPA